MKTLANRSWIAMGFSAMLLAGCVSPAEQMAMDRKECQGYGFTPNSDAFANCMMTTAQKRKEAEERWQAENMRPWKEQQAAGEHQQAATAPGSEPSQMDCTTTETTTTAGQANLGGATTHTQSSTRCRSR